MHNNVQTDSLTDSDGRTVVLHDIVKVIIGAKGVARTLRAIMLDVAHEQNEFATGAG